MYIVFSKANKIGKIPSPSISQLEFVNRTIIIGFEIRNVTNS